MKSGLALVTLVGTLASTLAHGQDVRLNVTYVCSGERLYVESCNIRDLSDAATCQVIQLSHLRLRSHADLS